MLRRPSRAACSFEGSGDLLVLGLRPTLAIGGCTILRPTRLARHCWFQYACILTYAPLRHRQEPLTERASLRALAVALWVHEDVVEHLVEVVDVRVLGYLVVFAVMNDHERILG